MCTLIYATVPAQADLARLPRAQVGLVVAADSVVSSKLCAGELLCWVTGLPQCIAGGHCGTVLGRDALPGRESGEEWESAQATKLRKKGWSEHKVQSWLAQKRGNALPPNMNGEVDELALWNELLRLTLDQAQLRYLGLMVFTAGEEPESPIRGEDVSRSEVDLTRLEQRVLYRIHR